MTTQEIGHIDEIVINIKYGLETLDFVFPLSINYKIQFRIEDPNIMVVYAVWFNTRERLKVVRIISLEYKKRAQEIISIAKELDLKVKEIQKTFGELKKFGDVNLEI